MGKSERLDSEELSPLSARYRLTTVALVSQVTLIAFEAMAVATSMPTVVKSLDGLRLYGWAFTAFLVANVLGVVLSGLWCDRHGARRSAAAGVLVFAAGLTVAGLASDMSAFIAGRALQGFGAGLLIVAIYVMIAVVYPDRVRPRVFAMISAAWVLPALIGPVIAGALAESGLWRVVFLGLLPILALAVMGLAPAIRRLTPPEIKPPRNYRRLFLAVAAAAGLAGIQLGGQRFENGFDAVGAVLLIVGLALLASGLRVLWPKGTIRMRAGTPATVLYRGLFAGAFFGMESLLPLTLTTLHDYSATAAGLPLMVGSIGWTIGSTFQGRTKLARHSVVRLGAIFLTICAAGQLSLVLVDGAGWLVYPFWIIGGMGMGMGTSTISVLLLQFSAVADRGVNSAALTISETAMGAICVGLGGTLVAASVQGAFSFSTAVAIQDCFLVAVIAVGILFARRLRVAPDTEVLP